MARCARCKRLHETLFAACPVCLKRVRDWKSENAAKNRIANREWKNRNWARRIVAHSRDSDRNKNRMPADDEFITIPFLLESRDRQDNMCCYCTIDMQVFNRKLHNGLTVQRHDNNIGHTRANCSLVCHQCNCRRVETGCNEDYVRETRARLYFERLIRDGYSLLNNRCAKIKNANA